MLIARLGLEPRYSPPEGDVLPLDDLATLSASIGIFLRNRMKCKADCISFPPLVDPAVRAILAQ